MKKLSCLFLMLSVLPCLWSADTNFVVKGKTDYTIVYPDQSDDGNRFALKELKLFLKKGSGIEFKAVPSTKAPGEKRIFLGLSDAALKILGKNPLPGMKTQEFCVKTIGNDLFLFGKGPWGDLNAVYDYLENVLGYRWYDARGGMKVPDCRNLPWRELDRKNHFSVKFRSSIAGYWIFHCPEAHLFFLRNRQNFLWLWKKMKTQNILIPEPEENFDARSHTLPHLIPGTHGGIYQRYPYRWLKNQNYWKTNPEFFGIDKNGVRSGSNHLCFSNPGLRKELTANVLELMKRKPDTQIHTIAQYDSPGKFCYCPDCAALEEKYKTPAAAYFVYMVELAKVVAEKFPRNRIRMSVYRNEQTQIPPSGFEKLPESLMPCFAPIDDDFSKSWKHPNNAATAEHLKKWGQISSCLALWYYPNPYGEVIPMPIGNIGRLVTDIQQMIESGMTHMFFEHNVGVQNMIGFTELQSFLILQLAKDISQNPDALIREFMEFEYGKAAPLMLKYLNELEYLTKKNQVFMSWSPSLPVFRYLTPENLVRWHGSFNEMEKMLADNPIQLYNVKRVKINLEMAMLLKYNSIIQRYPDFKFKPQELADSIRKVYAQTVKDFYGKGFESRGKNAIRRVNEKLDMALIQAGKQGKPLPAEIFGNIPPDRIFQTVPVTRANPRQADPDAAWGVSAVQTNRPAPQLPYPIGFKDFISGKHQLTRFEITQKMIGPRGKYKLYHLGKLTIPENSEIRFGYGRGDWYQIRANLGDAYKEGTPNQVEIYASLKFEGPLYYKEDAGKQNKVYCDRVVVVRLD